MVRKRTEKGKRQLQNASHSDPAVVGICGIKEEKVSARGIRFVCAFGIWFGKDDQRNMSSTVEGHTEDHAELEGIYRAIEFLVSNELLPAKIVSKRFSSKDFATGFVTVHLEVMQRIFMLLQKNKDGIEILKCEGESASLFVPYMLGAKRLAETNLQNAVLVDNQDNVCSDENSCHCGYCDTSPGEDISE